MKKLLLALIVALTPTLVSAEVYWQDFSITYLRGNDYKVEHNQKSVLTFEHAAATSWGDSFFFMDHLMANDGQVENYAEWSPRISLSKMTGYDFGEGVVKDVLFASNLEMSQHETNILNGIGFDLNIPGFQYIQANIYHRQNDNRENGWQFTTVWAAPFKVGGRQILYDGFLDWISATKESQPSLNMTSQLKVLVSDLIGVSGKAYIGVEYVYWLNKYGIKDSPNLRTNESNLNLLIKYHF